MKKKNSEVTRDNHDDGRNFAREFSIMKNPEKVICIAFKQIKKENPEYSVMGIYRELAERTGFSERKIRNIISKYL